MKNIRHRYSLLISLSFHLLIFLALGICFAFPQKNIQIGDQKNGLIRSYLYKSNVAALNLKKTAVKGKKEEQEKLMTPKFMENEKKFKGIQMSKPKKVKTEKSHKRSSEKQTNNSSGGGSSKGQQTEALLALLHAAIQQKQHYPPSAQEMGRQGRATIKFILQPDGAVQKVAIAHSSGTRSLDEAALEAVNDAAPFNGVQNYIHAAKEYTVDVVFEIA